MTHSSKDKTLALAGVFQAASLVKQIANTGTANSAIVESSIESLFRIDADNVAAVYGNIAGVNHGLHVLQEQLSNNQPTEDLEITKYAISMIALERKLSRNKKMLDNITDGLQTIESQLAFFSLSHNTIFSKIAELYKTTISTLGRKIMVSGEQPYLSNETNASKVRALLLAGIRSAVLWQQCGGSRWQFIFRRKTYLQECEKMLRVL